MDGGWGVGAIGGLRRRRMKTGKSNMGGLRPGWVTSRAARAGTLLGWNLGGCVDWNSPLSSV